jgi:hypothetical protein
MENNKYPRFITNAPCGTDLFEGKSQEKIAASICNVIRYEKSCSIIGIDGGWGSGKSNLVKQVQKTLTPHGYHFFIYDAWGHQEDLQRRSFLEELTENLTNENNNILTQKNWKDKLKKLLARTKETESKKTPKLSVGVILAGLAILLTPISKSIAEKIDKNPKTPSFVSILVLLVPLFLVIGLYIYFLCKQSEVRFKEKAKKAFSRLFLEYQNKLEEETKYEMISEDEPSVRKFRDWMTEISADLGDKKLILVFDNMDRLPQKKVQELWASIHVFFSEHAYENIKVIIPFDREHIKLAFKSEDNDQKQYGDDFINKTFDVVYRVSPPILSDWKNYFAIQWSSAFGEGDLLRDSNNVLQIFDLLNEEITPRRIIAFINEFVSIKLTVKNSVPNNYIALFILGKSTLSKKPVDEIINPSYLKGLHYLYASDEDLPKFIAALFYQVDPEKAIQIVFRDRVKRALDNNDYTQLEKISSIPEFYHVLESAIAGVGNYENAILALDKLPPERIGGSYQAEIIWSTLYKKVGPSARSQISDFQLILLSRISSNDQYLESVLHDLISNPAFSATEYYQSINEIDKRFKETLSVFSKLKPRQTSVPDFLAFVHIAKSEYAKYKVKVDQKELNDYLTDLEIPKLKAIVILPYLKAEYSLLSFTKKIEELIIRYEPDNDTEVMDILFTRYKEVSDENPLPVKLSDSSIYSLFVGLEADNDFYYDMIAMRIAKLEGFNSSYARPFEKILANVDEAVVDKVANVLEYYLSYEEILLNLKSFGTYSLFKELAKRLTNQSVRNSTANPVKLISSFQEICEEGEIEPKTLLKRLDEWESSIADEVSEDNIKGITSAFFFKQSTVENFAICMHFKNAVIRYFHSLNESEWKEAFMNLASYEVEVSLLVNYSYSTNAFEAFKDVLNDISSGRIPVPDKELIGKLIETFENSGRNFKAAFNTVRDTVCRENSMTVPIFRCLGEWLFKYADIEINQSSLRTMFTTEVIHDNESFKIILSNQHKMPAIIASANEEAQDFKDIIRDKLVGDRSDALVSFAKLVGVNIESEEGDT